MKATGFDWILFDLDGTLTDPAQGITGCVQYALRAFGVEEPDLHKLEPFIGPPLRDSFMELYGFTAQMAEEATAKYRERFRPIGIYENSVYPGIPELLSDLRAAGRHLAVASSKPEIFVKEILRHFALEQYFDVVTGSELDGTRDRKEEVVAETLRRARIVESGARAADDSAGAEAFRAETPRAPETCGMSAPLRAVMVGDRRFDIEGGQALGIATIGVAYGYGSVEELREAGAGAIASSVVGLRALLLA